MNRNQNELLFPEHISDLAASGISVETAQAAGLRSVKGPELESLLEIKIPPETTGLVFP
ncbi:MAG: hypothetical protein JRI71_17365, partial [Deltaproteobacteria bacterium]|nr:hypothetical protein [Deltaproteobacteria bacterium]